MGALTRVSLLAAATLSLALSACSSTTSAEPTTTELSTPAQSSTVSDTPSVESLSSAPSVSATSTESSTVTSAESSGLTADQQVAATAAIAAYSNFWQTTDSARISPTAKDWSTDVFAVTPNPLATQVMEGLNRMISDGQHQVNSRVVTSVVQSVDQGRVTILGCVDSREVYLVDVAGNSLTSPASRAASAQTAVVTQQPDGSWKLAELINPEVKQPC